MKERIIQFFRRGRWLQMAVRYASNPQQLMELLRKASQLTRREGWQQLGEKGTLLYHYVGDIATGRYKGYSTRALLLVVAALLYLITPVDFLPDFLLGGFVDDVSLLLYIIQSVGKELARYRMHRERETPGQDILSLNDWASIEDAK